MHDLTVASCNLLALLRSNVEQHPAGNGTPSKAGAIRIQARPAQVNPKANRLNSNSLSAECSVLSAQGGGAECPSTRPGRLHEQSVLFPEVPRGRRDYGSLTDHNFAPLLQGLTHVVFAYEVGRFFSDFWRLH